MIDYISSDNTVFEQGPLDTLAKKKQLMAYEHNGFGSQWTPLEIKIYLSICGKMGILLGKIGPEKNIYNFLFYNQA